MGDHVLALFRGKLHEFLHHDLVHSASEVHLDFVHDTGLIDVFAFKRPGFGDFLQNSELLLGV